MTNGRANLEFSGAGTSGFNMKDVDDASNATFIQFRKANGSGIGSISRNGLLDQINYNTSSDYRLKEDLKDFEAINTLKNIKVYDFKWINHQDRQFGVMAHELQEVVSYAVTGKKDELDEDNNYKIQSVDYSKLVPITIKAIQELDNRVKALENLN